MNNLDKNKEDMNNNGCQKLLCDMRQLISCIEDPSIRFFTERMVYTAFPAWQKPASSSHHLPDERKTWGNLLHSVRVASLCKLISSAVVIDLGPGDTAAIVGGYSDDVLLSAAILHDMCRHGLFFQYDNSQPNHPKLVRQYAVMNNLTCVHFNDIMSVIEDHMGKWSDPPVRLSIDAHIALHLADCIVARWAEAMPGGSTEEVID